MLKVKTFIMNSGNQMHHERLDTAINNFIAENGIEDVVDIKYSTSMSGDASWSYCLLSAMLIYKEL
ncbi:MAG: sporulation protein Cse60 [Prevotella sp.]|nr:sporulation protein Cse60 [Candidatus Equicola stercoris]